MVLHRWLLSLSLAVISALPAGAQELRVRLEGSAGSSLSGALVALVDSANRVHVESLSNEYGRVVLTAPPGSYRVRVRRIGYRPFSSDLVAIPRADELVLRVESPRVTLDAMVVSAKNRCGPIPRDAHLLSEAWEEIEKALRSRQLTADDLSAIGSSRVYKREVEPSGRVITADTTMISTGRGRPFAAVDPASLLRHGFVRGDTRQGWDYFGPDERVLLSPAFAATHCFRLSRDRKRPLQIGVAFEPVAGRRIADIRGVLWLDAKSAELREITFHYVNAEPVSSFAAGGFTRFRRMPSGTWIVSEWVLRMPKLAMNPARPTSATLLGYYEQGGFVPDSAR